MSFSEARADAGGAGVDGSVAVGYRQLPGGSQEAGFFLML